MVRELPALWFVVHAADLYAYADSLVPDIQTGADVLDLKSLATCRFIAQICPTANRPPSSPICCRSRPAMESTWRSWRVPSGARPRLAARSFTRTRGSLVKYGLRSGLSGFARRLRRPSTGSVGSSGRRSRAHLAKTPFCASLAMCRKDTEYGWGDASEVRRARRGKLMGPEAGIAPARLGCGA